MPRHIQVTLLLLTLLAGFLVAASGCLQTGETALPPSTSPAADAPRADLPGSRGPVTEPTDLGPFVAEPPSFRTEGLRIATFNVEFLFDGVEPEGQASFPWKGDPEAARNHRQGVARIIRALDADVVMLQEVENLEVLEMMIAESLSDMGYRAYYVPGRDQFTRQDVGMLARVPVDTVGRTDERARVGTTRQEYGVSKNMWARVNLGGIPTTLINIHFLARPDDAERKPQREAQAEVIRQIADREYALGREVIVLGDFNDFDDLIPDRRNSTPITSVVATIKSAGPGLRNVMAEVPQHQRFTNFWDRNRNDRVEEGEMSAIDHILLPPRFYSLLREVQYVHGHDPTFGPDHFPIVVTFALARPNAF
jgi:exonuclease III